MSESLTQSDVTCALPRRILVDFHRNPHSATSLTPPRVDAANVLNCLNFFPGENAQISIFPHCSYVQGSRVSNLRAIGEVAAEKVRFEVARRK